MTVRFRDIKYAGHSAVFIESENYVVAIDPWLNNPLCPAELKNPAKLDLIVLTHGHSDHAGDAAALAIRTGAKIAATYELCNIMIGQKVPQEQIIYMNKGGCVHHDGLVISLVHAFHSSSFDTENGPVYAGEACGVVLKDGNISIYHAGDTAVFSDMKLIADGHKPDIALLPVGDRFTMGPGDAARAAEMIGAKRVIPIHHSTFPLLTGKPEVFAEACAKRVGDKVQVCILKPGESLKI